jgi:hypothetical protein
MTSTLKFSHVRDGLLGTDSYNLSLMESFCSSCINGLVSVSSTSGDSHIAKNLFGRNDRGAISALNRTSRHNSSPNLPSRLRLSTTCNQIFRPILHVRNPSGRAAPSRPSCTGFGMLVFRRHFAAKAARYLRRLSTNSRAARCFAFPFCFRLCLDVFCREPVLEHQLTNLVDKTPTESWR